VVPLVAAMTPPTALTPEGQGENFNLLSREQYRAIIRRLDAALAEQAQEIALLYDALRQQFADAKREIVPLADRLMDLTDAGLRTLHKYMDDSCTGEHGFGCLGCEDLIALRDAARAEGEALHTLQASLLSQMPGRRCVRPDHNGGEGSEGRDYGYMCGGCAFDLAQEEAAAARAEQRERDAKMAFAFRHFNANTAEEIAAAIRAQAEGGTR